MRNYHKKLLLDEYRQNIGHNPSLLSHLFSNLEHAIDNGRLHIHPIHFQLIQSQLEMQNIHGIRELQ